MASEWEAGEQSPSTHCSTWWCACFPRTTLPPPVPLSLSPPFPARHSLFLSAVLPVRLLLHPLLTDGDAARLLRVCRAFPHSLLPSFPFNLHVFKPRSEQHLRALNSLYGAHNLRMTRMCLPRDLRRLELEGGKGRSPLPSTLVVLALGEFSDSRPIELSIFSDDATARLRYGIDLPWRDPLAHRTDVDLQAKLLSGGLWRDFNFVGVDGCLGRHLQPSLLPRHLRILQFGDQFDSPIEPGVLPPTIEYLHMGSSFSHPLTVGVLPPSLIHLVLGSNWNQPLAPDVLPPLLQCLQLGTRFNQPLVQSSLPPSLRVLELGANTAQPFRVPSVLPPFLTHLRIYGVSRYLLIPGLIPQALVSLDLCVHGIEPLRPGVLPASLRDLGIGPLFGEAITAGALPEGLEFLRIDDRQYSHPLGVGVIPRSTVALDLPMSPGVMALTILPPTVRWLKVRMSCRAVVTAMSLPMASITWR